MSVDAKWGTAEPCVLELSEGELYRGETERLKKDRVEPKDEARW